MTSQTAPKMFENDTKRFIALQMDIALETVVLRGLRFPEKARISRLLMPMLERRGAQLIRGFLKSLNPELFGNVQRMDERIIWRIYWDLQRDSEGSEISIHELLKELNTPPLAFVFT